MGQFKIFKKQAVMQDRKDQMVKLNYKLHAFADKQYESVVDQIEKERADLQLDFTVLDEEVGKVDEANQSVHGSVQEIEGNYSGESEQVKFDKLKQETEELADSI